MPNTDTVLEVAERPSDGASQAAALALALGFAMLLGTFVADRRFRHRRNEE